MSNMSSMKSLFKRAWVVAAAATLMIGCAKEATETIEPAAGDFTLQVVMGTDTRTEIYDPGEGYGLNIRWSAEDQAAIFLGSRAARGSGAEIEGDLATFACTLEGVTAGTHTIQGFYPDRAYAGAVSDDAATSIAVMGLELPAVQRATTETFDRNADIMVVKNMDVEITDDDIAKGGKTIGDMVFGRTTAITQITFEVTNAELAASDEQVESIALTVENENASENKMLAGTFAFDPAAFQYVTSTSDLTPQADCKDIFYTGSTNKVTVVLSDTPAVKDGFTAWISTAPVTLGEGDRLTFTVTTTRGSIISKTATVGRELDFMTTRLNTMKVKLDDKAVYRPTATAMLLIQDDVGDYVNGWITAADGSEWYIEVGYTLGGTLPMYGGYIMPTVNGQIQKIVLSIRAFYGAPSEYYFGSEYKGEHLLSETGKLEIVFDLTQLPDKFDSGYIWTDGSSFLLGATVYYFKR